MYLVFYLNTNFWLFDTRLQTEQRRGTYTPPIALSRCSTAERDKKVLIERLKLSVSMPSRTHWFIHDSRIRKCTTVVRRPYRTTMVRPRAIDYLIVLCCTWNHGVTRHRQRADGCTVNRPENVELRKTRTVRDGIVGSLSRLPSSTGTTAALTAFTSEQRTVTCRPMPRSIAPSRDSNSRCPRSTTAIRRQVTTKNKQEVKVIWQKAPHRGPIPRLGVTPGGRNLYHWIPGVGVPISVP